MDGAIKYFWRMTPPDYLPCDEEFSVRDRSFRVDAEGSVCCTVAEGDNVAIVELEEHLRAYLDAAQLKQFRSYSLKASSRQDAAGLRVFVRPVGSPASGADIANVFVLDVDGKVVFDAREQQARKRQAEVGIIERTAEQLFKCRDDRCLRAMQHSFERACTDLHNELIHLYEIRDAAASRFSGRGTACQALGIAEDAWNDFHNICNNLGLNQDRHRGSKYDQLRQATPQELGIARQFARDLIMRYIAYIEKTSTP